MSFAPLQIEMQNQQIMCQILCDLLNLENMNKLKSTLDKISSGDQQTLTDIKNFNQIVNGTFDMFRPDAYKLYGNPQTEDGGYKNYILSVIETYMYFNKLPALPEETLMLMVYYVYNYLLLKKDVTIPQNQEKIKLLENNIIACKNNTSSMVEPPVSKLLGDFLENSANIKPSGQKVLPIYFIGEESFGDAFGIFYSRDTSGKYNLIPFKPNQKKALADLITQHDTVNISSFVTILSGHDMYTDDTKPIVPGGEDSEHEGPQVEDSQEPMDIDQFENETPFEDHLKKLVEHFRMLRKDATAYDASKQHEAGVKEYLDLKFLLKDCFEPITNQSRQVIGMSYSFDITPPPAVPPAVVKPSFPILKEITTSVKEFEANPENLDSVNDIPLYFICQVGESASHIVTILYIEQKVYSFGYGFLGLSDRQQKEQKIADIFKRFKELHTGSGSIYTADFLLQLGKGYKYPLIDFGILTSKHVSNIEIFLNKTDTLHVSFELVFETKKDFDNFSIKATKNLDSTGNCFMEKITDKDGNTTDNDDFYLIDLVLNYVKVDHRTMLRGKDFPTYFEICQQVSGISETTKNYNCTSFVGAIFEHIKCSTGFFGVVHPKACHNLYINSEVDMLEWFTNFTISYYDKDPKTAYTKVLNLLAEKQKIDQGKGKRSLFDAYSGYKGNVPPPPPIAISSKKSRGGKTKNRQQKTRKTKNRKTRKTKNRKTRKIKRRVTKKKNQKKYSKNKTKKNRK
jgi:hypothetical protein